MSSYRILYWHQIPSMVEAWDDRGACKRQLSPRFQELIDRVAMRRKLAGTDSYMDGWRRGRARHRDGGAEEVAEAVASETEAEFEAIAASVLKSC